MADFENSEHAQSDPAEPVHSQTEHLKKRTSARMTHSELKTLKAVQTKEDSLPVQVIKAVEAFWANLFTSLAMLVPGKKASPCHVNGHVYPKGAWDGDFPRCTHCGEQITDAGEFGGR